MWRLKVNGHGVATCSMWKSVEINNIHLFSPHTIAPAIIMGYCEESDTMVIEVFTVGAPNNKYMVQLKSMQAKNVDMKSYHGWCPFTSFYTPSDCSSLVLVLQE